MTPLHILRMIPLLALLALLTPIAAEDAKHTGRGLNLVPLPVSSSVGTTVACLARDFELKFSGAKVPWDLREHAERMRERVQRSHMRYLSPTYGAEFFPGNTCGCDKEITHLEICIDDEASISELAVLPVEKRVAVEKYALSVPAHGTAKVTARTALGAFRGLTSFENLWYELESKNGKERRDGQKRWKDEKKVHYAPFAPYEITDEPAFPWRSVLLDTSRHYYPLPFLRQLITTMARVKLNVFHWHITDSQSWPLELQSLPELAEKGAYGSRVYSEKDVKSLIAFAAQHGIDTVVEIDTPGHTASIYESHPELIACYGAAPWAKNANEPPPGQLRFADPKVTEFVSQIFTDTMQLTSSPYFGTGGDELNVNCMMGDAATNASLAATNQTLDEALGTFTRATHKTLLDNKRTPVVWEEMVLAHGDLGLDQSTVVDVWISNASARAVADKGFRLVHAASDFLYLDCGHGGWVGVDGGLNSWCDPFKSWQKIYSFDPYANITESQRGLVLGGQTSLWSEQADETNFETIIWPRAAAAAEVWWSGATNTANGTYPRSSVEAFPRMHDIRYRLVDAGVSAVPLQPEWCALRPHLCDLDA